MANRCVLNDLSGTMTTGGTAQVVSVANSGRKYFLFQNQSAEVMWINFGAVAVADRPSIQIPASGGAYILDDPVSGQSVSVISATTGSKFTCKEGV